MPKTNFEVQIVRDGWMNASVTSALYARKEDAYAAHAVIKAALVQYEEKRPNSYEKSIVEVLHDLGLATICLKDVRAIHVFHKQDAYVGDEERRNDEAMRFAQYIAVAVKAIKD